MTASADVVVIGAGLHGCSTALHCRRAGLSVILLDKDHAGRHASSVNAGGVRRLNRHPAEIPLAQASLGLWHAIEELVGDTCGFRASGQVRVAEDEADLETLARRASLVRGLGYDHEELVGRDELRALVPAIAPHCPGALVVRDDGFADPARTTRAFRRRAVALGARLIENCHAQTPRRQGAGWLVPTSRGPVAAARVVNCAGAWGGEIAAGLGEPVPIEAVAPMLMITERRPRFVTPVVGSASRYISLKQLPNGTVLIGGGTLGRAEPARNRAGLDLPGLAGLTHTALDLFPALRGARLVRSWAGIEGRLPDGIPVIGPSARAEGVFHAFGFSLHGFQLGPIVGAILAELIESGRSRLPIAPFAIGRFADSRLQEAS